MDNKLKVFEAFSGYGSQALALKRIEIPHEVVAISEIDKYAIKAYEALHGKANNLGDISKIKIDDIPDHDLFTYSFPCTDISIVGKQEGLIKGKTRSGLLYECEKIIEHKRPKYLLLENVKNLVSKKFKQQFDEWLKYLESLGYTNYWEILNSKDFGIPQNRERVFVVSILGEHEPYKFPSPIKLDKCILDILENNVNEKYYINNERCTKLLSTYRDDYKNKSFYEIQQVTYPKFSQQRIYSYHGIAPTISAGNNGGGKEPCKILLEGHRVRKLTPTECFRLMGMNNADIDKIICSGISDSQLYKMAGNSIVIPVLEGIFKNLFLL